MVPKFKQINDVDINEKLKKAIKTNQQVTIGYKSLDNQQTERGIWPLGLVYWGKVWTLVAWCLLRQDYRVFRLDKITRLTSTEHTFETSNCLSLQHYIALQEAQHCEK